MPIPFTQQNVKIRTALLLFVKGAIAPMMLYFENPEEIYAEFQLLLKNPATVKLVEKETIGPIKKISVMSNQIFAVALQDEQYM